MALETVLEEIRKKGEEEAKKIREEAEREAEQIIAETKREAENILRKAREEAEKEVERIRKQEISGINLEMKKEELNKKREIVEKVYNKLIERIRSLNDIEREELLKKLLSKYEGGDYVVYSNKRDEPIVKKLTKMPYAGNIECLGGVVLESKDGSFRINLTFDNFIETVYREKMKDVYEKLFGGG